MIYLVIFWVAFSIGLVGIKFTSWQFWLVMVPTMVLLIVQDILRSSHGHH